MSITAYKVVKGTGPDHFATVVAAAITAGFQPFGAPMYDTTRDIYSQAMVEGTPVVGGGTSPGGTTGQIQVNIGGALAGGKLTYSEVDGYGALADVNASPILSEADNDLRYVQVNSGGVAPTALVVPPTAADFNNLVAQLHTAQILTVGA
ncbi:MAG: hypothetical protein V4641_05615 [Pseudomonadota bacterium]